MQAEPIRVFQTHEHDCGYYPDRQARNLVIDPVAPELDRLYARALASGFRRSGGHVYRPQCARCQACVPVRIAVREFKPNRTQRRCLARNADVQLDWSAAEPSAEVLALYQRYLKARHPGGGMDDADANDFERFLRCDWSPTRFMNLRAADGQLLAVAVTDVLPQALSAVYTFYDPEADQRGPGTLAILHQIDQARRLQLDHLYLGYWIHTHPKMDYKRRFQPMQQLLEGRWQPLPAQA